MGNTESSASEEDDEKKSTITENDVIDVFQPVKLRAELENGKIIELV